MFVPFAIRNVHVVFFNPLYSDRFFHSILYNTLGMVHCTYRGTPVYNFKLKLNFFIVLANSVDTDKMPHDAGFQYTKGLILSSQVR